MQLNTGEKFTSLNTEQDSQFTCNVTLRRVPATILPVENQCVYIFWVGVCNLYHSGNIPDMHFCWRMSRPQGGRKDYVNKNSIDTIGNRTRDLPACSAVPQPTAPPCAQWLVCTTRIDIDMRACVWPMIALSLFPRNENWLTVTWQELKAVKVKLLCKPWRHEELEIQLHTFLTLALNGGD